MFRLDISTWAYIGPLGATVWAPMQDEIAVISVLVISDV